MTHGHDAEEPLIRPVRAGDAEALLHFYQGLSEATVRFYEPYSDITPEKMAEVIERAASGQDVARVLVTQAGDIVGHAFLMDIGGVEPSFGIGLADDWQNRGYGPRLMAEVMAEADARPTVQSVILTVNKRNTRALNLYRRFGFEVYGECDHREPKDSYRMRRMPRGIRAAD